MGNNYSASDSTYLPAEATGVLSGVPHRPLVFVHDVDSHACGAILGAAIGDAAGATCEFSRSPSETDVSQALEMVGKGPHELAPGQITDDTELAICLARGLINGNSASAEDGILLRFSAEMIAIYYILWAFSDPPPFDIGGTTNSALSGAEALPRPQVNPTILIPAQTALNDEPYANALWSASSSRNGSSKANGSVMRCTPLAVWGHRLVASVEGQDTLAACVWQDSSLTHCNATPCAAEAAYVLACAHLIYTAHLTPALSLLDRANQAVNCAEQWAIRTRRSLIPDPTLTEANIRSLEHKRWAVGIDEVLDWISVARGNVTVPCTPMEGFVRIGFIHAFRSLLQCSTLREGLRAIISGGGDTDTNAAIVGGLIGALHGVREFPPNMILAVLDCVPPDREPSSPEDKQGQPRPTFLYPYILPELVDKLYRHAPVRIIEPPKFR